MERGQYEEYEGQTMVEHPNGYYGCLYGKSSMAIFKDNKEVIYTASRGVNTPEELWDELEGMPEFMQMLKEKR